MKKFPILFFLVVCYVLTPFNLISNIVSASAKSSYTTYTYAQVQKEDVYLYKTASSPATLNAMFKLPQSYFVLLLSSLDDVYYKAQYKDVVGFVLKSSVCPVKETPKNPYPTQNSFRIYASDGTNMLNTAFNTKNALVIGQAKVLENIELYGEIEADEYIANRGTLWYYGKNSKGELGYFYSGYCDQLNTTLNTETVTPTSYPTFNDDITYLYNLVNLTPALKIVSIVLVIAPCLIIIPLLFKPFKLEKLRPSQKKNKTQNQTINKIQKIIDDEQL